MIFVDEATILVSAGSGGNGMTGFRREPFVDRGGPDGGDGGKGANVVFVADQNLNTLSDFRHTKKLSAEDGANGARAKRHGRNGDDMIIKVPVGTIITAGEEQLADLGNPGQQVVVARGGDGGYGNAHFTSSVRQAPAFAEKGEKGEELELSLELKMIADVGLVGLPNAGKSTFLSVASNARPAIADYPFTTLTPNLGVADVGDQSLLIADIPGLIEGASEGKGLGDEFLRHVERTAVLIHLVDIYSEDVAKDYKTITNELKSYKVDLTDRQIILVLTKAENMDQEIIDDQKKALKKASGYDDIHVISSVVKQGVQDLLKAALKLVEQYRDEEKRTKKDEDIPTITLDEAEPAWRIADIDGKIVIIGGKIEKFARRTDFDNDQSVRRLRDIMVKMGIARELKKRKLEPQSSIQIGRSGEYRMKY